MKKIISLAIVTALAGQTAFAALEILTEVPAPPPIPTGEHACLPQRHDYQKQLRGFMATLKEADFRPVTNDLVVVPTNTPPGASADDQFRTWLLSVSPPAVGHKRNFSSVRVHPALFTIPVIEGATAILRPPAHAEPLVDLADWHYAGNPHDNLRALRLRAFVLSALDMIMLDELLETGAEQAKPNQDQLAGAILRFAYVYPGFCDVVTAKVREAYLAGLRKLVRRALDHGPKELPKTLGLFTIGTPALALASQVLNDAAITTEAEGYARLVFTDPRFFRAAGYFPHGGSLDSFNGISLQYALWGASAAAWPFARDAMTQACRLRAHLTLPEPDGYQLGPSHMGSLTSADSVHDQWNWPARAWAAALLTDEAACLTTMPDEATIRNGPAVAVSSVNGGIHEMSWTPGGLDPKPWALLSGVLANVGYRYYPRGYYARRAALEKTDLAKLPVLREGSFVRRFADEFLVAKTPTHALIIHTGPITNPADPHAGLGFGGGAISAFWTRPTGAVILGRGIGAWAPGYKTMFGAWRSLPTHAVSGITATGKGFTSAHIATPETTFDVSDTRYTVIAHGLIPASRQAETLFTGTLDYSRRFEALATGVRIATTLKADSPDAIAELYEVLPVYLRDAVAQPMAEPTTIEFRVDGKWAPAVETLTANVTAARLRRFDGAVDVIFDKPARVKLAPAWTDSYMSHASCRNILIDMLGSSGAPAPIKGVLGVSYRIEPSSR